MAPPHLRTNLPGPESAHRPSRGAAPGPESAHRSSRAAAPGPGWVGRSRTSVVARAVVCLAFVVGFLTASPGPAHGATAVAGRSSVASYDVFTGSVDEFYAIPSPLPTGAPGDLIRVQDVSSTATSVTKRIMYHSVDDTGHDRAVIGLITYPTAPAPPGGWPVVSIANGTVGLASKCAPSRGGHPVPTFGLDAVGVDSDYIGMGLGETQAYLARASEGHSVIDAVRAARNLAATGAGDRFVVIGVSQGGHGALSANELAAGYAPDLHLLGTVALAPAAMFDRTYGPADEVVTRVVGAMGFYALSVAYPSVHPADYLTPAGLAATSQIGAMCTDEIVPVVLGVPLDGFYTHDPLRTEPARSLMLANDVGNVRADSPVLLVQGTADTTVVPARTHDLLARMCGVGQTVQYREVQGADHNTVEAMDLPAIEAWLTDRLAGRAASTSCGDALPGDTAATVPAAAGGPAAVPAATSAAAVDGQPSYTG